MTGSDYASLRASVQVSEGLRLKVYTDTTGHQTIGYGHNLEDGIPPEIALALLDWDLNNAIQSCEGRLPYFKALDGRRQRVLAEMALNMGIDGLLEFSGMLNAVQLGRYDLAAAEMLRSTWATQVGLRARRLSALMQLGAGSVMA